MVRSAVLVRKWRKHAVVDKPVHAIQLLVFEVPDTRHKIEAQQVTQGKDDLGVAVGIRRMLANLQNRVVFQQPIEDVRGLAGATRNHLGAKDGGLVGDVGVDADGLLVVAVIPWVIGRQQTAGPHAKALGIRGGEGARAMHGAQGQCVMAVDNLGTGRGERFLPHEVMQHMPEHVDRDALDAGAHRHHTEIGGLGNQGGQERFIEMRWPGLMSLNGREVAAKAGEVIDLH